MQSRCYFLDVSKYEDEEAFQDAYRSLSRWRREKVDRLRNPESRLLSLGAGILVDEALRERGFDPDGIVIAESDNGRPYIPECEGMSFSLSHSGRMAMCAVSDRTVGCDIQIVNEKRLSASVKVFSDKEGQIYERLDKTGRTAFFYRVWVLKESLAKADGRGLLFPMKSVTVMETKDSCAGNIEFEGKNYLLAEADAPEGYRAAVCNII